MKHQAEVWFYEAPGWGVTLLKHQAVSSYEAPGWSVILWGTQLKCDHVTQAGVWSYDTGVIIRHTRLRCDPRMCVVGDGHAAPPSWQRLQERREEVTRWEHALIVQHRSTHTSSTPVYQAESKRRNSTVFADWYISIRVSELTYIYIYLSLLLSVLSTTWLESPYCICKTQNILILSNNLLNIEGQDKVT